MADEPKKKGGGLRTLLIVFAIGAGAMLLACLACGLSGYFWIDQNAAGMREMGERVTAEANAFAATHDQAACVEEGLRRHDLCGQGVAIMCQAEAQVFLRRCLDVAAPTAGLCEGVPPATEIMAGATWAVGYCARLGHSEDRQCPQFVRPVVEHCAGAGRAP